jgi:hypothetical protein
MGRGWQIAGSAGTGAAPPDCDRALGFLLVIGNVAKRASRSEPSGDRIGPVHTLIFAEIEQAPDPPPPESSQDGPIGPVPPSVRLRKREGGSARLLLLCLQSPDSWSSKHRAPRRRDSHEDALLQVDGREDDVADAGAG